MHCSLLLTRTMSTPFFRTLKQQFIAHRIAIIPLTTAFALTYIVYFGGRTSHGYNLTTADRYMPVVVVYGPPGSGTEQIAKRIANEYDMKFVNAQRVFEREAKDPLSPAREYLLQKLQAHAPHEISTKIRSILMDRALTDYNFIERGAVVCGHPVDEVSSRVFKTQLHNIKKLVVLNADENTSKSFNTNYLRDELTGDYYHPTLLPPSEELRRETLKNNKARLQPASLSEREFQQQYAFYQQNKEAVIREMRLPADEISVVNVSGNVSQIWHDVKDAIDSSIIPHRIIDEERENKYKAIRYKHKAGSKSFRALNRSGKPPKAVNWEDAEDAEQV